MAKGKSDRFGWRWMLLLAAGIALAVFLVIHFTTLPAHVDYLHELGRATEGAEIHACKALAQETRDVVDVCVAEKKQPPACEPLGALAAKLERCVEDHRGPRGER